MHIEVNTVAEVGSSIYLSLVTGHQNHETKKQITHFTILVSWLGLKLKPRNDFPGTSLASWFGETVNSGVRVGTIWGGLRLRSRSKRTVSLPCELRWSPKKIDPPLLILVFSYLQGSE